MTKTPAIAIFDIGKTNKKLILLNENYKILLEDYIQIPETVDEDGDNCENLQALTDWIQQSVHKVLADSDIEIKAFNFSAYGASFVHINSEGKVLTPLYNYLKPYPEYLKQQFYESYGGEIKFSQQTASPALGSLNSGLQLYRLKNEKPETFQKIKYSLHLPQFISYIITRKAYSDITSIGCHTGLWHFERNNYHEWVYQEQIIEKLAPIFPSDKIINVNLHNKSIPIGVGLHDSSAALIPYIACFQEPFLLLSTGTWNISLNPFNKTILTPEELQKDCLCYLDYNGNKVKASRLFAGNEHEEETQRIADYFFIGKDFYKSEVFNSRIKDTLINSDQIQEKLMEKKNNHLKTNFSKTELSNFNDYTEAYYNFMLELITRQVASTKLVIDNSPVKQIFVDGGFSKNQIFMNLLAASFPQMEVYAASVPQSAAIGAAIALHAKWNKYEVPSALVQLKYIGMKDKIN